MEQLRLSLDSPSDVAGKLHYQKTPRAKPLYCMRAKHIVSTIVVFICIHVSFWWQSKQASIFICPEYIKNETRNTQELSYRKQIARQLRTQFVDGISVTLKSTLRVTQGHWKRNHWTDHTQLTVRRVIGRWILSWPWNVGQRSLKVIESATIWKFGYGFLTYPTLTLTLGLGVKVIKNGAVR